MEKIKFDEAQSLLDSGKKPGEIFQYVGYFDPFNAIREVGLGNKLNYIDKNNKLLSPNLWFDNVGYFYEHFGVVRIGYKYNYINEKGGLLSNIWFDLCLYFKNGFGVIYLNGKWNCIKADGKLVSDIWFDIMPIYYRGGIARTKANKKMYIIDKDGKLYEDILHKH